VDDYFIEYKLLNEYCSIMAAMGEFIKLCMKMEEHFQ